MIKRSSAYIQSLDYLVTLWLVAAVDPMQLKEWVSLDTIAGITPLSPNIVKPCTLALYEFSLSGYINVLM